MRRLWWKFAFPIDCELSLTREEKLKVWECAQFVRYPGYWRKGLVLMPGVMLSVWIYMYALVLIRDWLKSYYPMLAPTLFSLLIPLGMLVIIGLWMREFHKASVYRALREHGYDICLNCGYWLKELPLEKSKHCPECGEEREPLPKTNPSPEPDSPS